MPEQVGRLARCEQRLARLLSESTDLALTEPVTLPSDACTEPAPAVVVVERILYFLGYWKKEATQ